MTSLKLLKNQYIILIYYIDILFSLSFEGLFIPLKGYRPFMNKNKYLHFGSVIEHFYLLFCCYLKDIIMYKIIAMCIVLTILFLKLTI